LASGAWFLTGLSWASLAHFIAPTRAILVALQDALKSLGFEFEAPRRIHLAPPFDRNIWTTPFDRNTGHPIRFCFFFLFFFF
jgi:hypothetical protein